jgi:hypothetical protein
MRIEMSELTRPIRRLLGRADNPIDAPTVAAMPVPTAPPSVGDAPTGAIAVDIP